MTTEQHLIAALNEAIKAIQIHNEESDSPCFVIDDPMIQKWLAIPVTCPQPGYETDEPHVGCPRCHCTNVVPLSEVI